MKVAVVSETFLPAINGVTGSVLQVLRHLGRTGHGARVFALGDTPATAEGFDVVNLPSVGLPGYPQVRVPVPVPAIAAGSLSRGLAQFRPDVIHLASPFTLGGPVMRVAATLGIPVVAIYQTDVAGFARRYGFTAASNSAWRHIRSVHERAQVTLAPSPSAAQELARHDIPRVEVWPRGVDTAAFSAAHRDDRLRARLAPAGEVLVGFVGRLAAEKQVEDLEVLLGLPGVRLVVIGDGAERERLVRRLPGAHFLGELSGPDLSRAVASLDVVVHPGPYETFCQAAQEAMASGVPVVAVRAGGLRDLVDHSRTGWLYPPGDLAALRAHVVDLAGDQAKRQAMGAAAHAAVRARTWPVVCDRLLLHYERAVSLAAVAGR
ncbi:glycosyltransferase family 4 protein [Pengzhenrongella sicca]|uniref:D-inositol 3-phosphate glycosyltransferase n=1 Tax=Pengzhenrongella sicca TaxID=2819238 RepID=A0A8A4ZDQ3_9MICO|nr:glycosyltransferase family 1 protein [Pengzhenrongella sicca]QTE30092.1 glycosyltransferase family 1 protein [Pengzhenrongella sicca]